jgi:phosphate/sulfate permease
LESGATLALIAVALAYAFDFANGFHDTANAVATIIYTNAMKSRNAIIMSGLLNFLGAVVVGTAVAMIITEVVPANVITMKLVLAALIAGGSCGTLGPGSTGSPYLVPIPSSEAWWEQDWRLTGSPASSGAP